MPDELADDLALDAAPLDAAALDGDGRDGGSPGAGPSGGDRLAETLQAAALQMIGSARAFLDVAERAVYDPQVVGQVAAALVAIAKGVVGAIATLGGAAAGGTTPDDPPLEHIDVG
jgi:hypothetical protein